MLRSKLNFFIGILLILTGILVPSTLLIEMLREKPVSTELWKQLLLGASLFRAGLVILGIFIVAFGRTVYLKTKGLSQNPHFNSNKGIISSSIAVILLAALALRLYGLSNGLWYDEIAAYVNYMKMPFGEIITTYASESQHPLFTLFAHACFKIFGESSWVIRLPAVLFGVGSIWALYLLGLQVTSRREALLSAALLTFFYHHIWFSQNARGYTGLLFWTILSSWLLLRGLSESERKLWIFYAISTSLGVYTHVTMLFVVIGHFLIFLMTLFHRRKEIWPEKWECFFLGFCLAGLLTLLLYSFVLPQLLNTIGQQANVPSWKNPLWTLYQLAKGMQVGFGASFVVLGALVLIVSGTLSYARHNPAVLALLFVPSLVGSVTVMSMGHPLWPRFFFFVLGFGVLVVVRGTTKLGEVTSKLLKLDSEKSALTGTVFCCSLIFASAISIPHAYAPKQDYAGALAFVEQHKQPNDIIMTVGLTRFPYKSFYKTDWQQAETLEELNAIKAKSKRTWLVYTLPLHLKGEYPDIMSSVEREFKVVKQFYGTLGGGTIYICLSELSI